MRREDSFFCTLIAEQVLCTKLASFVFAPSGHRHLAYLSIQTFVLLYYLAGCFLYYFLPGSHPIASAGGHRRDGVAPPPELLNEALLIHQMP